MIEASFEFGAAVEMSFVVASGSLSVMAGIYFRLEIEGESQSVQLTGFFRARGEVDVLGLIQACIELYLELSYRAISGPGGDTAKAVGKASISVEVSVCFLSFSYRCPARSNSPAQAATRPSKPQWGRTPTRSAQPATRGRNTARHSRPKRCEGRS
jgi:hypothetical protein